MKDDTVWLNLEQISELFLRDKSVISRHIKNIFKDSELEDSVIAKFATTAVDGKTYQDNTLVIDNNTLTALTLLIAESNPKEKSIIIDFGMKLSLTVPSI